MARELLYLFQSFCCFNSLSSLSMFCDSALLGHLENDCRARNNLLRAKHRTHLTYILSIILCFTPDLTAILRGSRLVWAFKIETSHTDALILLLFSPETPWWLSVADFVLCCSIRSCKCKCTVFVCTWAPYLCSDCQAGAAFEMKVHVWQTISSLSVGAFKWKLCTKKNYYPKGLLIIMQGQSTMQRQ